MRYSCLFGDFPLYFRGGPGVESMVSGGLDVWAPLVRHTLLTDLSHRIRLTQVIEFLSTHSPVLSVADISTVQSKFDVILVVSWHRVSLGQLSKVRRLTRIMVRRTTTAPGAAVADVMLETSCTRFKLPMATFSKERAPSRHLGCWGLSVIFETRWPRLGRRSWRL